MAETDAELAAWCVRIRRWDDAREYAKASVQNDAKLSLAHEDMGFLNFNEGKDEDASNEFTTAAKLDNKNYIALFGSIMTSSLARSHAPEDQQAIMERLNQVVDLKPDFAPAYVELAKLNVAQGSLPIALALVRKAVQLEPYRAGYRVLAGEILRRMNRPEDAVKEAHYVIECWPDQEEAIELLSRTSAGGLEARKAELKIPASVAREQSATGTVRSVSCSSSDFAITLDVQGIARIFKGKDVSTSHSETLWVGRDHFNPCFHVQGLRASVKYKPAKDDSYAGDLVSAGFREDLPVQSSSAGVQAASK